MYEFYVYAFFLGLARDLKIEITVEDKVKTFWEMENWKPKELIDYLLACAIAHIFMCSMRSSIYIDILD